MAYQAEKDWVKDKIRKGEKIPKTAAFYQTLKRAEKNLSEIQSSMDVNDVDSHTY